MMLTHMHVRMRTRVNMRARRAMIAVLVIAMPVVAYASVTTTPSSAARDSGSTSPPARPGARRLTGRTTWDSVFTATQAARGETTYARTCARCHGAALAGADEAPALAGSAFLSSWNGQTLLDLHDRIRTTMPTDTPGTYQRRDITDVIAYVLTFNRFPAGNAELPVGDEELKGITFVAAKP
jgi:mono/diheme cytochrome c family protein